MAGCSKVRQDVQSRHKFLSINTSTSSLCIVCNKPILINGMQCERCAETVHKHCVGSRIHSNCTAPNPSPIVVTLPSTPAPPPPSHRAPPPPTQQVAAPPTQQAPPPPKQTSVCSSPPSRAPPAVQPQPPPKVSPQVTVTSSSSPLPVPAQVAPSSPPSEMPPKPQETQPSVTSEQPTPTPQEHKPTSCETSNTSTSNNSDSPVVVAPVSLDHNTDTAITPTDSTLPHPQDTPETVNSSPNGSAQPAQDISPSTETSTEESDPVELEQQKMRKARFNVQQEMLVTEQKYVEDLTVFVTNYIKPLRDYDKYPCLSKSDFKIVFSTIEMILEGNQELLKELKEKMASSPETAIGSTFRKIDDKLQYYSVYCNHQEETHTLLEQAIKDTPALKEFIDSAKLITGGHGLLDFYVKPFQRLLKYPLLLQELLKSTPETHPDYENLVYAKKVLQTAVDNINLAKAHAENMKQGVAIAAIVKGLKDFVHPDRRLMKEGEIFKISKNIVKKYVYVFNDYLLLCKVSITHKQSLQFMIPVTQLGVELTDEAEIQKRAKWRVIKLVWPGHKPVLLSAKTEKETADWEKAIRSQVQLSLILNPVSSKSKSKTAAAPDAAANVMGKVRVYYSAECFKTFAISKKVTVAEFCPMFKNKMKREDFVLPEPLQLYLCRAGGDERVLDDKERPLEIQMNLVSSGVQFGTKENKFRVNAIAASWTKRPNRASASFGHSTIGDMRMDPLKRPTSTFIKQSIAKELLQESGALLVGTSDLSNSAPLSRSVESPPPERKGEERMETTASPELGSLSQTGDPPTELCFDTNIKALDEIISLYSESNPDSTYGNSPPNSTYTIHPLHSQNHFHFHNRNPKRSCNRNRNRNHRHRHRHGHKQRKHNQFKHSKHPPLTAPTHAHHPIS
ncbi:calmodulin-binding protein [Pelomyxa schiedti]|nr:calmodulin-binding protein [Pelomyxa schiedti]